MAFKANRGHDAMTSCNCSFFPIYEHSTKALNLIGVWLYIYNLGSFGALKLVTLILALQFLLKHTHITVLRLLTLVY